MEEYIFSEFSDLRVFVILSLSTAIFSALWVVYRNRHSLPLPPGPRPLPVIGNLHQFDKKPWESFKKWHHKYGPLISVHVGQRTLIVIGSHKIAHDLLDRQSAIYSTRPRLLLAFDYLSKRLSMPVMPNSQQWQTHRRIVASLLSPAMCKRYQHVQDIESKRVLHDLLTSNDFPPILDRYIASIQFTLGYGFRLESADRTEISEIKYIAHSLAEALHRVTVAAVELFPILDHLPQSITPWRQFGQEKSSRTISFSLRNLEVSQTRHKQSWTWVNQATRQLDEDGSSMKKEEIAYMMGTMQQGSFETTPTTLRFAIKALLLHPAAAGKAQQELEETVGSNRLPEFEDIAQLAYLNALIKEVLRWQVAVPFGMPHSTSSDQEYMGYRIPQGSLIVPNQYELAYNADIYAEPFEFQPERWLENPGLQDSNPFGYGRRVCPGRYFAWSSISIILARILWGYDIEHAVRDGQKVPVGAWDNRYEFSMAPEPFEVSFNARSIDRQRIIEREFEGIETDVDAILKRVASSYNEED